MISGENICSPRHVADAGVHLNTLPRARSIQILVRLRRFWEGEKEKYMVSLSIWPWVSLLLLFINPWLCLCVEETPAVSCLPADRPDSWTHGWMEAHPIKPTGEHTKKVLQLDVCVCVHGIVFLPTFCLCDQTHFSVCVCVCVGVCLRVLNSYWPMKCDES